MINIRWWSDLFVLSTFQKFLKISPTELNDSSSPEKWQHHSEASPAFNAVYSYSNDLSDRCSIPQGVSKPRFLYAHRQLPNQHTITNTSDKMPASTNRTAFRAITWLKRLFPHG
jgi:hypothetical protein